jgi:hypothetical protein
MANLRLESGAVPTDVTICIGGRSEHLHLSPGETRNMSLALGLFSRINQDGTIDAYTHS